jgi:hypothetical protein
VAEEDVAVGEAIFVLQEGESGVDVEDVVGVSGIAVGLWRGGGGVLGKLGVRREAVVDAGEATDEGTQPGPGVGG